MTVTVPDGYPDDFGYDVETFKNYFCCTIQNVVNGRRWIFEIIDGYLDQSAQLVSFIYALRENKVRMVGFNNEAFDYVILHHLVELFKAQGYVLASQLHAKAQQIFASQDNRFANIIWPSDRLVTQLDLFKIHHFDNRAKATSLKVLEFNMRSHTVEDIPHDPNVPLTLEQIPDVLFYNCHDVNETIRFYGHTLPMIRFRDELTVKYGRDFTNHNDTKIGKDYFVMELEKARPGICYTSGSGRRQPRQTHRREVPLSAILLPSVRFLTPEFNRVLDYIRSVTITDTKSAPEFKDLHATLRGFRFDFGTGGIHGSLNNAIVRADADHDLIDVDVASFYPNLAIVNRIFPEHLTELFCDVYQALYLERKKHPKKSTESGMLKLALNGVFGDSNSIYGPFYDPAYMLAITVNGQLLLCMLAEWLLQNPLIEPVQINTDGITVRVHKSARGWFDQCYSEWQKYTSLELERVDYSAMFIRDVNNYMAVSTSGKVKRIGAYIHETQAENPATRELWWNKDWSALVIPKAVEAVLVNGVDLETFVYNHPDPFDFMIRARAPRNSGLQLSDGTKLPGTVRYHISRDGPGLVKTMPQLAKTLAAKPDAPDERVFRINVGWSVNVCNQAHHFNWSRLEHRYYIEEARKLMGMVQ